MIRVLHVAAEAVPFAKTGELGDVIGSLPKELINQGVDARVIMPRYRDIPDEYLDHMTVTHRLTVPVGWRQQACDIAKLEHEGVTYYFLGNDYYFDRSGLYGFQDDCERFAFFCRAVLEALPQLDFKPDVLHCHEWHTGMVSVLLDAHYRNKEDYNNINTMFTVHNALYQGNFSQEILGDMLDLGWEYFTPERLEFSGQVSFLKGGLTLSDYITTVSKSYADEIMRPDHDTNLDGLFGQRKAQLVGIMNGVDYTVYNPGSDSLIFTNYDARSLKKRRDNKLKLQAALGLTVADETPLIGIVSRLVPAKGLDLITEALEELLALNVQLVILGVGEEGYHKVLLEAAQRYPAQVSVNIRFDNPLAHRIYAGADIFLTPSRYEPSGLSQLNAMRYGSVPVVRATGGLKDTVMAYNAATGEGNGIIFSEYDAQAMLTALRQALELFDDKKAWAKLVRSAMKSNFSWRQPGEQYKTLYSQLIAK